MLEPFRGVFFTLPFVIPALYLRNDVFSPSKSRKKTKKHVDDPVGRFSETPFLETGANASQTQKPRSDFYLAHVLA